MGRIPRFVKPIVLVVQGCAVIVKSLEFMRQLRNENRIALVLLRLAQLPAEAVHIFVDAIVEKSKLHRSGRVPRRDCLCHCLCLPLGCFAFLVVRARSPRRFRRGAPARSSVLLLAAPATGPPPAKADGRRSPAGPGSTSRAFYGSTSTRNSAKTSVTISVFFTTRTYRYGVGSSTRLLQVCL
ncbi:MAG: hypothetical protein K0Q94_1442 [Paenibacillus sp.]|nr:hypothetical protein [Paenibacillus sp.]